MSEHATGTRAAVVPEVSSWNPKANPRRHLIQVWFCHLRWRHRIGADQATTVKSGRVG